MPVEFHGQRILAGHRAWGYKELYTTEHANTHTYTHTSHIYTHAHTHIYHTYTHTSHIYTHAHTHTHTHTYICGALGFCCCNSFSLISVRGGYSLVAVHRLLLAVASLMAEPL